LRCTMAAPKTAWRMHARFGTTSRKSKPERVNTVLSVQRNRSFGAA
jgi:hypothetical protein